MFCFPDTLVGLIVANAVDGLVVVDGPPVFPVKPTSVVPNTTLISGIGMQYFCFTFSMQVT